jgi:tRNA(Ile)-lysidine synthase
MNIRVEPGVWIVAVSGGVDSVALLHMLSVLKQQSPKQYKFVVAHVDHGIRPDSAQDRVHVQQLARQYDMPFVYHQANLGPDVSESTARDARYQFLDTVRKTTKARGIITAHHQDDVLETAVHNLLRGTGRRGLTALTSHDHRHRPLIDVTKRQLVDHAHSHRLTWREDSTNQDIRYTRNYIRHRLLSRFTDAERAQLTILLNELRTLNADIDQDLAHVLHLQPAADQLGRKQFILLPHGVARELMHTWLRTRGVVSLDRPTIERAVIAVKAGRAGQRYSLDKHHALSIDKTVAQLTPIKHSNPRKKPV